MNRAAGTMARKSTRTRAEAEVQFPSIPASPATEPEKQKMLQLAQINPRSAILEAWQSVEFLARRVAAERGEFVPPKEGASPLIGMRALVKANVLSAEELALYNDLRALRNQAAHAQDFNPTYEAALNFIELASRLHVAIVRGQQ